jgi:hypothetical protein
MHAARYLGPPTALLFGGLLANEPRLPARGLADPQSVGVGLLNLAHFNAPHVCMAIGVAQSDGVRPSTSRDQSVEVIVLPVDPKIRWSLAFRSGRRLASRRQNCQQPRRCTIETAQHVAFFRDRAPEQAPSGIHRGPSF